MLHRRNLPRYSFHLISCLLKSRSCPPTNHPESASPKVRHSTNNPAKLQTNTLYGGVSHLKMKAFGAKGVLKPLSVGHQLFGVTDKVCDQRALSEAHIPHASFEKKKGPFLLLLVSQLGVANRHEWTPRCACTRLCSTCSRSVVNLIRA